MYPRSVKESVVLLWKNRVWYRRRLGRSKAQTTHAQHLVQRTNPQASNSMVPINSAGIWGILDLAHSWASSNTTHAAAHHAAGALAVQRREDSRYSKGSETEPEERGHGLSLVAALAGVVCTVGDAVRVCVALVVC